MSAFSTNCNSLLLNFMSSEQAYAWGFDLLSWQHHLSPLTWPEVLRQFALSAGFGPKLKRKMEPGYAHDANEARMFSVC